MPGRSLAYVKPAYPCPACRSTAGMSLCLCVVCGCPIEQQYPEDMAIRRFHPIMKYTSRGDAFDQFSNKDRNNGAFS